MERGTCCANKRKATRIEETRTILSANLQAGRHFGFRPCPSLTYRVEVVGGGEGGGGGAGVSLGARAFSPVHLFSFLLRNLFTWKAVLKNDFKIDGSPRLKL